MAAVDAQARAQCYSLVAVPLFRLPDEEFAAQVQSEEFASVLARVEEGLGTSEMSEGLGLVRRAVDELRAQPEVLDAWARDRTYLFRALAPDVGAPPPYESFWHVPGSTESVMAGLTETYRRAGMDVAPDSHERVDYLGVELMFMMQLVADGMDAEADEFFRAHLGRWVPRYVAEALPLAQTDFFKGLLQVLSALLKAEEV